MANEKTADCWMITGSVDEYVFALRAKNVDLRAACDAALDYLTEALGECDPDCDCIIHTLRAALEVKNGRIKTT